MYREIGKHNGKYYLGLRVGDLQLKEWLSGSATFLLVRTSNPA